jgi:hypothetical protein
MSTTRLSKVMVCPECGYKMDSMTSIHNDRKPKPGDWALCLHCGSVLVIKENLEFRFATPEELFMLKEYNIEKYEYLARAQFFIMEKNMRN